MVRNAVEIWGEAVAPNPTGRSGEVMSGWVCGSEGKERIWGKDKRGSWEEESCRREGKEEKDIRVSPTTLKWGARGRSHPFGECWKVPGHGIQVQRGHLWRQGGAMALQES